ncbi:MAG TPA: DUF6600 domain-containing protein [Terracidiphilus sp.]|jgi:hypothetical protein
MSKTLLSKAMTFLSLALLVSALHAQANDATANTTPQQPTTSKVRIVRLSMVKGAVEIERSNQGGFERAIANLPVVEKNQLRTEVGIAEVEFEDNSSLRLAPNTTVEFAELGRNANGATVSSVRVIQGTAYVSLVKLQSSKAPVNEFTLLFGDRKLVLDPATHVRFEREDAQARLAVMDGTVRVDGAEGALDVSKKKTVTFDMAGDNEPKIAKDIEKTPFDGWDHDATSYHAGVASVMSTRSPYAFNSPYSYGLSDMMYYGNFQSAGGCGSMWRPYFASAAWDPFSNGTWAWYQGAGYSWVSPYPWAWTPYHYGSWGYCPNVGWGWTPGGSWYGVNNVAALSPATIPTTGGGIGRRLPPPHPPTPHQPTMVAVSLKPLTASAATSTSFEFRKDSAGLGVPRETLGHLDKFSHETVNHGVAKTSIYVSAPEPSHVGARSSMGASSLGASIHRGSPPSSPSPSSSWSASSSSIGSGGGSVGGGRATTVTSAPAPSAPSGGSRK